MTARIWDTSKWECERILVDHGAAVWDVMLIDEEEDLCLTGELSLYLEFGVSTESKRERRKQLLLIIMSDCSMESRFDISSKVTLVLLELCQRSCPMTSRRNSLLQLRMMGSSRFCVNRSRFGR